MKYVTLFIVSDWAAIYSICYKPSTPIMYMAFISLELFKESVLLGNLLSQFHSEMIFIQNLNGVITFNHSCFYFCKTVNYIAPIKKAVNPNFKYTSSKRRWRIASFHISEDSMSRIMWTRGDVVNKLHKQAREPIESTKKGCRFLDRDCTRSRLLFA